MIIKQRAKLFGIAILLLLFVLVSFLPLSGSFLHYMITLCLQVGFGLSLWILVRAGLNSLGHSAFIGIGGYTTAILTLQYGWPVWPTFIVAGLTAAVVAIVIGQAVLHTKGMYFLVVTFSFLELLKAIWTKVDDPFGGALGLNNIPRPEGFPLFIDNAHSYYLLALLFMLMVGVCSYLIVNKCQFGLCLDAMKDNDTIAASIGIPIKKYRTMAFATGCFFAGIGGGILISYITSINPYTFTFLDSLYILMYNLLGGATSIAGPILGATLITTMSTYLYTVGFYKQVVFGIVIVVVMLTMPNGIINVHKTKWANKVVNYVRRFA